MNRLETIAKIAQKLEARRVLKARLANKTGVGASLAHHRREARKIDKMIEKMDENYNHWTDSASYAKEFYGETCDATVGNDEDWN